MEDLEKRIKELEKEVKRLTKANGTLRKREDKLQEEVKKLTEELDMKEALAIAIIEQRENTCPLCGMDLMEITYPNGRGIFRCKGMPVCKFKREF